MGSLAIMAFVLFGGRAFGERCGAGARTHPAPVGAGTLASVLIHAVL